MSKAITVQLQVNLKKVQRQSYWRYKVVSALIFLAEKVSKVRIEYSIKDVSNDSTK